ncbi:short chain dehydrogenase [Mycolicibacterium moriokaense]|uniref:Short chain dehydrogenase n=1 Tax=Mycolicibacterium moriokaense TaxID=39691 RepID=A0AAD1H829_9MYCO|nr:SDR family oxidoreductase [Mycolicibacterium moriokaense]MCV7041052.1 SDR family oxidoreductase [Mycolicibacterium moriokaense]ORB27325.1 short chain dehydrogenase [Mycolicibacterium moriokaense]BBX00613.1 short chain dehydrogenase [Mycolicibacterium moriokaense]
MHQVPTRIVLVTGGSRGVGAEVAQKLASPDTHVVVNYRQNAERAESIAEAIRDAGGHASTLRADISDETQSAAMIDTIAARFGRLDALILNASVGPALGVDLARAKRINRDAQRRLALRAVPLMPAGGHIIFVTSHAAHFFPHRAVPKGQTAIAASKWAGETALYAMRSEFRSAGVHLTVVSGDASDPTFANAIVNAANAANPSGIVYVGGADSLKIA